MHFENDENFNFLFNEEFEKIPWLFRFSKRRFIASLIIIGVLLIAGMIFLNLFYESAEYQTIASVDAAHSFGFNDYNYTFLIAMILSVAVVAFLAAWIVLAKLFEKRAFRKVTKLCNMINISERSRTARIWSDWKMNNRDY